MRRAATALSMLLLVSACRPAHAPAGPAGVDEGSAAAGRDRVDAGDPESAATLEIKGSGEAASAALEPELLDLLTAHQRAPTDAPATAAIEPARSTCHPERPASPSEASLCLCEAICARPIDREAFARRWIAHGGDRDRVSRWLVDREPGAVHYPYVETDGTRFEFDGEGRVTRCRHHVASVPGSAVDLVCPAGSFQDAS